MITETCYIVGKVIDFQIPATHLDAIEDLGHYPCQVFYKLSLSKRVIYSRLYPKSVKRVNYAIMYKTEDSCQVGFVEYFLRVETPVSFQYVAIVRQWRKKVDSALCGTYRNLHVTLSHMHQIEME